MPIFTAIAAAITTAVSTFFTVAGFTTFALSAAASVGLSYAAQALAGQPSSPSATTASGFSVQGTLNSGGDVPRSFNLGYSVTAGSLVYANTWGTVSPGGNDTPNAYLTQVIALSDLPGGTLQEFWVNGAKVTLGSTATTMGFAVAEYAKDGNDHLWIRYYDGTQTTVDSFLNTTVASVDRPYLSTRVGTGIAYAIVTSLVDDTLWGSGIPTFKFALSGVPLYDVTKDSTQGGSGSHRFSDKSTWGGDGDQLPAVQLYNVLMGVKYGTTWLYGLQGMSAARLEPTNWISQINKCRATITGISGPEPTYRSGGQVNVNSQVADTVQTILTTCQGKLSEIGGFYKVHLGAPDTSSFSITDDIIISTEEQSFTPFYGLSDTVNGITGSYPSPAQGWNTAVAPPVYRTDLEARDGNRRLLADVSFDFVPYDAQVQRLMSSAVDEAQRARQHTFVLPPEAWQIEPGDFIDWTSTRNGYDGKLFRVDGVLDKANLDVTLNVTEVDPSDYDWNHSTDFKPVVTGPTGLSPVPAQAVLDWTAEGIIIADDAGSPRRPAIIMGWDNTQPGVSGVQYQIRLTSSGVIVTGGRTDQLAAGSIIVSQSLLPNTAYQARGQYLPSSPRDMLWSDWLDVTTPDVRLSLADFGDEVIALVNGVEQFDAAELQATLNLIASTVANQDARNWDDKKEVRSQLAATNEVATAAIETVETVAVDTQLALASFSATVTATFGPDFSSVNTVSTAIAGINGQLAASFGVTLTVDGYATGFQLLNGGTGISSTTFIQDKFQVAAPGPGATPIPIFTIANVGGSPKVALRGDMIVDGSVTTQTINAGAITAQKMAAKSITAANGAIDNLAVLSLNIGDNAVTVPAISVVTTLINPSPGNYISINSKSISINTTGLAGKTISVSIDFTSYYGGSVSGIDHLFRILANGSVVAGPFENTFAIPFVTLNPAYTFTASGGTDVVSVDVQWNAIAGSATIGSSVLRVMGVIR